MHPEHTSPNHLEHTDTNPSHLGHMDTSLSRLGHTHTSLSQFLSTNQVLIMCLLHAAASCKTSIYIYIVKVTIRHCTSSSDNF
ncbi:hypothetical protein FR483_n298L [Paramecium bursaria Chlorella virus FR483]|uniref:Uncharacterized protein n298L n=1 Tax=Paramecium bursaria Chlorella virus FR483 TaxID=399781 RepID=A7J702_PBCVF|nr:hypothetical protein FR483_n298L [Paramecium bursaria Chlorella virus FR483]ABT15583.1 hypothetical protein FR483_n298L [Paramecium bursaria Chlorella virus FR483]